MKRVAIIGGGPPGLGILAEALRQPQTLPVVLLDPDPGALVFRLADYGYTFAENVRLPLAHTVDAVREHLPIDLVVDAAPIRSVRHALARVAPELDVVGIGAARYLWELAALAPIERREYSLKRFKAIVDEIDLSVFSELAYVAAETIRVVTGADRALVFRWDDASQRLVPLGGRGGFSDSGVPAARAARERRVIHGSARDSAASWLLEEAGAASVMAAPILSDDETLGAVELWQNEGRDPFPQVVAAWIEEFTHHMVRAMKKIRTLREVRHMAQGEGIRRQIKTILDSQSPIRERLQRAVESLAAVMPAGAAHLYVRSPQSSDLSLQASTVLRMDQSGSVRIAWGAGLVGETAQLNRPVILQEQRHGDPTHAGARTVAVLPLPVGKDVVGVLVLEAPPGVDANHRFANTLAEAAELLGASIASDAERHAMSQKVIKLSTVNEEGLQLLSITSRDKVLMTAAASTAMILDAEAVVIRVRQRRGDRLLVGGTYGLHRDEIDTALIRLDQDVADHVVKSNTFVMADRLDTFGVDLPAVFPYHAVIAGPLYSGDQLVGTISAYNKVLYHSFACGAFDRDDQYILEKYSFYLARALIQAHEVHERQALITIDEITGLRNQRYVDQRLPEEFRRAERYQRRVALLILEVIDFEDLCRPFTQKGREEILRALAGMARETFRNVDILARLDGSRFSVVMPDTGDTMAEVLSRLRNALALFRLRGTDGRPIQVRLAVGTCTFPGGASNVQEMLERASELHPLD